MNKIAIVILHHTDILNDYEKDSLQQCFNIFSNRDIIITCPNSVNEKKFVRNINKNIQFKHIDDHFFSNKTEYNHMLLTKKFYTMYQDYDFILVYQLDGYVFRDDLDNWTKYEYVGAPWCHLCCSETQRDSIQFLKMLNCSKHTSKFVGNGGVSLRDVKKFIQICDEYVTYTGNEDTFFSEFYNKNSYTFQLKKPDCIESAKFSAECHARYMYKKTGHVPSFCHQLHIKDAELFNHFKQLYQENKII